MPQIFNGIIEEEKIGSSKTPVLILKDANAKEPRPIFFFQSGFASRKESMLKLMTRAVEAGFIAVSVDARRHGSRTDDHFWRDMNNRLASAYFRIVIETAFDYAEITTKLKEREDCNGKSAALGVSLGAFIITRAKLNEGADFDVSVAALGGGDFRSLFSSTEFFDFMQFNVDKERFIPPILDNKIHSYDPINNIERFSSNPFFIQHGGMDEYIPRTSTEGLYEKLKSYGSIDNESLKFKIYEECGHMLSASMIEDAFEFITSKINN